MGRPSIFFEDSRFIFVMHVDSMLYLSIEHNPFTYTIYIKLIFLQETSNFHTGFKYINTTALSSFCISLYSTPLFIGCNSLQQLFSCLPTHTHTHKHTHPNLFVLFTFSATWKLLAGTISQVFPHVAVFFKAIAFNDFIIFHWPYSTIEH